MISNLIAIVIFSSIKASIVFSLFHHHNHQLMKQATHVNMQTHQGKRGRALFAINSEKMFLKSEIEM